MFGTSHTKGLVHISLIQQWEQSAKELCSAVTLVFMTEQTKKETAPVETLAVSQTSLQFSTLETVQGIRYFLGCFSARKVQFCGEKMISGNGMMALCHQCLELQHFYFT